MDYNKKSIYEKPHKECPNRCGECDFYENKTCNANGCRSLTYDFCRPTDRPLPMPLNCYWWYLNSVWHKVSKEKIETYTEERRHLIVCYEMLKNIKFDREERKAFIKHFHRGGGCNIIDFNLYPQARKIYNNVLKNEKSNNGG